MRASWGYCRASVVTAAVALTAGGASAKSTYESPYGYERTWNAALRLVRVDNGWKVTEKDDQNGYLLFDYKSPGGDKACPGSMESSAGRDSDGMVSVLVQLPAMPQYHEQVLLDALATKMRREYGDPPVRPPPPSFHPPMRAPTRRPSRSVGAAGRPSGAWPRDSHGLARGQRGVADVRLVRRAAAAEANLVVAERLLVRRSSSAGSACGRGPSSRPSGRSGTACRTARR